MTKSITLPDSGVQMAVDRVPPFLLADLRNEIAERFPKPKPPMITVKFGLDETPTQEPNSSDPAYQFELQQHNVMTGKALIESLAEVSVVTCDIDTERLQRIRTWASKRAIPLPESDIVVYVTRVALATAKDVDFFKEAVLSQSQPTEKAVERALETFRPANGAGSNSPNLQGAEHIQLPTAA